MISYEHVSKYCKDNLSLIENYEEAVNSEEMWDCHHRLETDLNLSREELKDRNLYFNRPASELIFLTKAEHSRIHKQGRTSPMKGLKGIGGRPKGQEPWNKGLKGAQTPWTKGKPGTTIGMHRVYHEDGSYHYEK